MPKLIVNGPNNSSREYEIVGALTIGRNPENQIQLAEEKASRAHCRVLPDGEGVRVEDLKSSNGTKVNGLKVDAKVLLHGDIITIGAHRIVFFDEKAAQLDGARTIAVGNAAVAVPPLAPPPAEPAVARSPREIFDEQPELDRFKDKDKDRDRKEKDRKPEKVAEREPEPEPEKKPEKGSDKKVAKAAAKEDGKGREDRRPRKSGPGIVGTLVKGAVAVALFGIATKLAIDYSKPQPKAATPKAVAKQEPIEPLEPLKTIPPPDTKKTGIALPSKETGNAGPTAAVTPELATPAQKAALAKAMADRDKSINSGNYLAARAFLASFLKANPQGEIAQLAKKELDETTKVIDTALEAMLDEARKAASTKKYRVAGKYCTGVIALDPRGRFGDKARALMNDIDTTTEPRFHDLNGKAATEVKAGRLDAASELLGKALDELAGSKWASLASAQQLELLYAGSLLRQIGEEVVKRAQEGKPAVFKSPSKKTEGKVARVKGLALEVQSGAVTLTMPLKSIETAELEEFLKSVGLVHRNLELAYLWLVLDRREAAQASVEKAVQDPSQAAGASRLAGLLTNIKSLKVYDFSGWQQQSDWEALSGSWLTQDERYVIESAEGGDTTLKAEALDGGLTTKGVQISFEFELKKPSDGYFFAFEFGDDQKSVSTIFSAQGVAVHGNVQEQSSLKGEWKAALTKVEIAFNPDSLVVTVNGKALEPLKVPGLEALKGTVTFRARGSSAAIDNVVVRCVGE